MKLVVLRGPGQVGVPERANVRDPSPTGQRGAVALSDQGDHWVLLNVAPNIASQLQTDHALCCHHSLGNGQPRSIVLTDAQVDHVTGLLSLRDGGPIELYVTPAVFEVLSQSMPVLQVLQHYCGIHWHVIPVAGETLVASFKVDALPALSFTALSTSGLAPPYLPEHESAATPGLTIALSIEDRQTGRRLFCAPGAQALGDTALDWLREADCVLLDDQASWPGDRSGADWQARHRVMFAGSDRGAQRASTDGFVPAHDGMLIEL